MADILSLKRARKAKKQADKQTLAAENRTIYGRTKAEKSASEKEAAAARKALDAHKRDKT